MYQDDKIWISKKGLDKACKNLKGLKLLLKDDNLKHTIDDTIEILKKEIKFENIDIEEINIEQMIKNKMKNTRNSNPDLNFKLYKLLRKLQNKKVDENEAMRVYEMYEREIDR